MGTKWAPEKLKNHKGMLGKTHAEPARAAISAAQKARNRQPQEGFVPGHAAYAGTEATRFAKGLVPWNKGNYTAPDPVRLKLSTYRTNAKKRGIPFNITVDIMREMLAAQCVYCGDPSTGIDRIDNTLGYVDGNMAPCCGICNHMKWNLSREDFVSRCRQIISITGYEI